MDEMPTIEGIAARHPPDRVLIGDPEATEARHHRAGDAMAFAS